MSETFTAVLSCAECGTELNRAIGVPESKKGSVVISAPLVAGRCKNGCRSSGSDWNCNTKLEWVTESAEPRG